MREETPAEARFSNEFESGVFRVDFLEMGIARVVESTDTVSYENWFADRMIVK